MQLTMDLGRARQNEEHLQTQAQYLEKSAATLKEGVAELQSRVDELNKQTQEMSERETQAQELIDQLQKELASLTQHKGSAEKTLSDALAAARQREERMSAELAQRKLQQKELQRRIDSLQAELEATNVEMLELANAKSQVETQLAYAQQGVAPSGRMEELERELSMGSPPIPRPAGSPGGASPPSSVVFQPESRQQDRPRSPTFGGPAELDDSAPEVQHLPRAPAADPAPQMTESGYVREGFARLQELEKKLSAYDEDGPQGELPPEGQTRPSPSGPVQVGQLDATREAGGSVGSNGSREERCRQS
mmetsp:Transcript_89458/g.239799  ORF Transcript_89458/g.239799 Transcript_89458/m.239799 type:complete len:307 (-) Transcript_89458:46-966(-)